MYYEQSKIENHSERSMLYRRLGRTNLEVSELGYGAARGARDDPGQFIATVRAAVEAGVNFVDTAAGYEDGMCEQVLGEALHGHDDVIVETKYRPYDGNLPDRSPYTDRTLFDFLQPYSVPEAALRFVLTREVSCCAVGMRNPARLTQNLRAVDPPYLDDERLSKLRKLFAGIRVQVR